LSTLGNDAALAGLTKAQQLFFDRQFVLEKGVVARGSQAVLFGQEGGIGGARAVQPGKASDDQLVGASAPAGVQNLHGTDALEFVAVAGLARGGFEEPQVHNGVDGFGAEDLGQPLLGGGVHQVELVVA
jgi:hypothetical protein